MKKVIALALSVLMAIAAVGCSSGSSAASGSAASGAASSEAKQGGGKLVIYSPNSEGLMDATIPLFEEKYGVDVRKMLEDTGVPMLTVAEAAAKRNELMQQAQAAMQPANPETPAEDATATPVDEGTTADAAA